MRLTIDVHSLLTEDQIDVLIFCAHHLRSLPMAKALLRALFPDAFIHQGGHHLSLHACSGSERILMLAEVTRG